MGTYSSHSEFREHEKIIKIDRPDAGLSGFIAIHDTTLGPAVGGKRDVI